MSSLNCTIQRCRVVHWNKKTTDETSDCIQEKHLTGKGIQKLRVKGRKSLYQENRSESKLMSLHCCGIKTQTEVARKDKEGHCTLIPGAVHQNILTI